MHFMGQEAVSRPTRGAGRILVFLGFVIWIAKFYDVSFQDLEINGVTLPAAEDGYVFVQWLVMGVLVGSHFMNWCGDRLAYRGWNTSEKVTMSSSPMGADAVLITKLDNVLRIAKQKSGGQDDRTIIHRLGEIRNEVVRPKDPARPVLAVPTSDSDAPSDTARTRP